MVFKIVFIASQIYIIYLMLNDYKPTHDPNLDTFKVEYLLGFSAVLGILFPYFYTPSEVRLLIAFILKAYLNSSDALGLLDLARIRSYPASAFYAAANWRSRYDNYALPFCFGNIPGVVYL